MVYLVCNTKYIDRLFSKELDSEMQSWNDARGLEQLERTKAREYWGSMNKKQIEQETISVCGEIAKGISFWSDGLYDHEWQDLSDAVAKLKALKEAAIRRQKQRRGPEL